MNNDRLPERTNEPISNQHSVIVRAILCLGGATLILLFAAWFSREDGETDPLSLSSKPSSKSTSAGTVDDSYSASDGQFTTSESCRSCHPKEHESWHASYHRTMTQVANAGSIVPEFDGKTLSSRGQSIRLSRRGDEFFATLTKSQKQPNLVGDSRQIVLTTGSHLMQTYWIRIGNELHQVPWFYHIEEDRWIPSEDSFLTPPSEERMTARWNDTCIECHSTGPVPGYDPRGGFNTRVAELGIACEACHGPGQQHVAFHEQSRPKTISEDDARMVNPAKCSHELSSQICAQCHSSAQHLDRMDWLAHGSRYRPGEQQEQWYRHAKLGSRKSEDAAYLKDSYWPDGTCRVGGDEYLGMRDSACFLNGELSCLTCHSMHNSDPTDQLRDTAKTDRVCFECHSEFETKIAQHTHHRVDSTGSQCMNCHMPHTSFALFKALRSHRIDIPRVSGGIASRKPNACNLCHLDQTLAWTADFLAEWYGHPQPALTVSERSIAASILWLQAGDAMQRALLAWGMSWQPARDTSGTSWQTAHLTYALLDPYSAVRFVAWRSLKQMPRFANFDYDFLADEPSRQQASQRALRLWSENRSTSAEELSPAAANRLLLSPERRLRIAEIEKLILERDNRPIDILE